MSQLNDVNVISVKSLLESAVGEEQEILFDVPLDQVKKLDQVISSLVQIKLMLLRVEDGIYVNLSASFTAQLTCGRCLTQFSKDLQAESEWMYAIEPDDESSPITSQFTIDLSSQVHDAVLLAIPAHPLCKPSCLGLCDQCGTNLNDAPDHYQTHSTHKPTKIATNIRITKKNQR